MDACGGRACGGESFAQQLFGSRVTATGGGGRDLEEGGRVFETEPVPVHEPDELSQVAGQGGDGGAHVERGVLVRDSGSRDRLGEARDDRVAAPLGAATAVASLARASASVLSAPSRSLSWFRKAPASASVSSSGSRMVFSSQGVKGAVVYTFPAPRVSSTHPRDRSVVCANCGRTYG